jgi:hypothetical protein
MNTISTTDDNEDLIHTKTIFRRHSKGPVMFNGCSPSGDVIIIENISSKKEFDLTGWYIERQTDTKPLLLYTFLHRFIIPPLTTVELWSAFATPIPIPAEIREQQSFVSIKTKLLSWNNARQWSTTRLYDHLGREKAIFSHRTLTPPNDEGTEDLKSPST